MSKRRKRRRRDNSKCKLDECVYLFVQTLIISVGDIYRINKTKVMSASVTDYRHCAETQDHRLEGSKTASTLPYILIADQYCLQITVPISSYYLHHFMYIYLLISIALQSSCSFNSHTLQKLTASLVICLIITI